MVAITTQFEIPALQTCAPHVRARAQENKQTNLNATLIYCLLVRLYQIIKAHIRVTCSTRGQIWRTDLEKRLNRLTSHF